MDDPNITMEEHIRLEEEKARRRGKVYNRESATYGKIWYDEDVYDLRSVETKFPAIVCNDAFTSEVTPHEKDNDDDKIDIKKSSRGNVINTDVGVYAQGSNKLLETSHDKSDKFFKAETFIKKLNFNIMT
ncbi:hypothetical protein Tco_0625100 [Tanacetum coccineum]|uniref:Uncharacterized protein n=1 Tax=Tanacetum coccineum TaxID=301880 RepID=A0ABQ4WFT4_9ASTR